MATTEVATIDFHGDRLQMAQVDGEPYIVLKPVFDGLGLDSWSQIRKLRERSWANYRQIAVVAADGKTRPMAACDVRSLLMLLATISEHSVAEPARPKLVAYQQEVADVVEEYWTKGGAINPRATPDQLDGLIERAKGQITILRMLDGIVDKNWLDAKARQVAARALGEEPEIDPATRPLTVGEYLEDKGVTGTRLRSISPQFGKLLKAQYFALHGEEPPTVPRFIDGAMRPVSGYTEKDRILFDSVWRNHYESGSLAFAA